jgi:hypothetical protein
MPLRKEFREDSLGNANIGAIEEIFQLKAKYWLAIFRYASSRPAHLLTSQTDSDEVCLEVGASVRNPMSADVCLVIKDLNI